MYISLFYAANLYTSKASSRNLVLDSSFSSSSDGPEEGFDAHRLYILQAGNMARSHAPVSFAERWVGRAATVEKA